MIYVKAIRIKFVCTPAGRFPKTGWYASWWENANGNWYSRRTQIVANMPALFRFLDYLFNRKDVVVIKRHEVKL